jgi:hypothetical protein
MQIKKKLTISLTESDVKEIITDYIVSQGFKATKNDVKLVVGTEWHGYGMGEYQAPVFKECTVDVKGE